MTNDNWKKSKEINDKVSGIVARMLECTDIQQWNSLKKELTAGFQQGKQIHKQQFYESWKDGHCKKLEKYYNRTFKKPEKTEQQPAKTAWKKGNWKYNNNSNNNGLQEIANAINRLADAILTITNTSNTNNETTKI